MGNAAVNTGSLWVGTSGMAIPGAKNTFPEAYRDKSRLTYYASLFNSLEVNSSFYNVPMGKTVARWATEVPDAFRFTFKVNQIITHQKQLVFNESDITKFVEVADQIGEKKGCLLVQFPGKITAEYRHTVEQILQKLIEADPDNLWPKAFEFRHPSWYDEITEEVLNIYGASLVLHDIPKSRVSTPNSKAPFIYWRFHGPEGDYRGGYDAPILTEYAVRVRNWMKEGKDVYVYFNNTIGDAFYNAQALRGMVEELLT